MDDVLAQGAAAKLFPLAREDHNDTNMHLAGVFELVCFFGVVFWLGYGDC